MDRPPRADGRLAACVVLALAVSACRGGDGAPRGQDAPTTTTPFVAVDPASASPTDRAIAQAQAVLADRPDDPEARLELAVAFLQKARETADATLYTKAAGLLDALAGEASPIQPAVVIAQGTLALSRHQFLDALALGQQALTLAPGSDQAYGIVVDADNELGRYDAALDATQAMVDARPGLAALSRVSYARELRGDLRGATEAMGQAIAAGGPAGEHVAYLQVIMGDLLLQQADAAGADQALDDAEASFPGFAPAKVARARLLVARGDLRGAADQLDAALDVQPLAETAAAYGDVLAALGDHDGAEEAYGLVGAIASLQEANGVDVDLEQALFAADHMPGDGAVALARKAAEARPSVLGWDALSWARFRAGDVHGARLASAEAMALGTRTPLLRFHAAAIAAVAGDRAAAVEHLQVVLEGNPRFSVRLLPEVEQLAADLGLAMPPPL